MAFGAGLYILGLGGAILLMILLTVIGVVEGCFKQRE
jgi:hypothetical protein